MLGYYLGAYCSRITGNPDRARIVEGLPTIRPGKLNKSGPNAALREEKQGYFFSAIVPFVTSVMDGRLTRRRGS